MMPNAFDDANVRAASEAALDVEKESADTEALPLTTLANLFKARGESQAPSEVELLLISDGLACDLWLADDGDRRNRRDPLGPSMEFGGAAYPPPLASFPDALRSYFERRASSTTRANLRARYHEVIWLRWRIFEHAREAHQAYLEAASGADLGDSSSSGIALSYLVRAADLSRTLKFEEDATITVLRTEVLRGLPDAAGYSDWLAQRGAPLISRRPDIARELVDAIHSEAKQAPTGRRLRERGLLEAAESLAHAVGDTDRTRSLRLDRAASYEAEALERMAEAGLIELALLNEAISLYAQAGASTDVQRLKPQVAAASERAVKEMHVVESTVSIPQSAFEQAANEMMERLGKDELLALGAGYSLGLWPRPERVEEALDKTMAEHPIQFLVSRTSIGSDGRYQPDPNTEPDQREARLTRQLAFETAARLAFGQSVIDELRHRGLWSSQRLINAARLVDPTLADACAPGFEALEAGRAWLAAHALVPQLERAVRLVARTVGVTPMKLGRHGGLRWASLDEMLGEPLVEGALGAGLASSLRRLYLDPYGPNYRNEIAHGADDPSEHQFQSAMLTALAIMSVALRLVAVRQGHPTGGDDSSPASA